MISTSSPIAETQPRLQRIPAAQASGVRIVPMGGVGEFGLNITCYESGGERIVVDAGAMFPEADMPGVDLVIPDVQWLVEEPERLKAFVLTHGHDDHIGALPYILGQIRAPVYGTRLTLAFLRAKLEEHGLADAIETVELKYRETARISENFRVTPLAVTHSIPNSAALAIRTPGGTVLHSGDYKIDLSPVGDETFDFHGFTQLGEEGVLALVADSTNASRTGSSRTERWVSDNLARVFADSPRAIFCAAFSTSVHRLQQIMDLAVRFGRRIFVLGRSLERTFAIASELGYLSPPQRFLCALRDLESVPPNERLILATGSQGEPLSVMSRLALGEHRQVQVEKDDTVILSARMIPANIRAIFHMTNHFCRRGARVYDETTAGVHASGHAYAEEMKTLISMVRPRFLVPVHGEVRQQNSHRDLAVGMGFDPDSIFVLETGDVLEVHPRNALIVGKAPTGRVLVDGKTVGETADVVLRDRQHLSEDGMVIAILNVDSKTGELLTDPEIVTRGFVYVDESEDLIEELSTLVRATFEACARETREESDVLNTEVRRALRKHIRKNFDRFPLILPVVQEI